MADDAHSDLAGGLPAGIRRLRLAQGLTQRDVAAPRYTRAFLAAIEAGIRTPSEAALRHIATRLGVTVDDLRYGRPPGTEQDLRDALLAARRARSRGEVDPAATTAREVLASATRYGLPTLACAARCLLGEVHLHRGHPRAAAAEFDAAAAALPADAPATLRALTTARRAYCRFVAGGTATAVSMLEGELRALRSAPELSPDAELRVVSGLLYLFLELGWRERARRLESEAAVLLPRVTTREWLAQFYMMAAQLRRDDAELGDVDRLLALAVPLYQDLGLTREIGLCHWVRGYVLRRAGRLAEAAHEFQVALDTLRKVGAVQDHAGVTLELAEVRRRQGKPAEAARLAAEAARVCRSGRHVAGMAEADRVRGLAAAGTGDPDTAERLLRRAADRYEAAGFSAELVTTCRQLGELLLERGRSAEAAAVFRRGLRGAGAGPDYGRHGTERPR